MPSVSEAQKTTACMALAIKRGDLKPKAGTPSSKMASEMSEAQLTEFCGSKVKGK